MRSWTELAVELNSDLQQVKQAQQEIQRGMAFAAAKARSGDPWPGEWEAKLQATDVMTKSQQVVTP